MTLDKARVDEIVGLLREKSTFEAYQKINSLIDEVVVWAGQFEGNNPKIDLLRNLHEIITEIVTSMEMNNIVYTIDLIRYDLSELLLSEKMLQKS